MRYRSGFVLALLVMAPILAHTSIRTAWADVPVELVGQWGGPSYAVAVSGDRVYVGMGPRLVVFDVSIASDPTQLGKSAVLPGIVSGVAVSGSYTYVASGSEGLLVIAASNPTSPTLVGSYDTSGTAQAVAVSGHYAYVADGGAGLQVIDISNPAFPTLVGS